MKKTLQEYFEIAEKLRNHLDNAVYGKDAMSDALKWCRELASADLESPDAERYIRNKCAKIELLIPDHYRGTNLITAGKRAQENHQEMCMLANHVSGRLSSMLSASPTGAPPVHSSSRSDDSQ